MWGRRWVPPYVLYGELDPLLRVTSIRSRSVGWADVLLMCGPELSHLELARRACEGWILLLLREDELGRATLAEWMLIVLGSPHGGCVAKLRRLFLMILYLWVQGTVGLPRNVVGEAGKRCRRYIADG